MNWAHATFPEEICPVLFSVAVVNAILEIEGQQVLNLDWCSQTQPHIRIYIRQWVLSVECCVQLEVERRRLIILLSAAGNSSSRALEQVLPVQVLVRPVVAEALIRTNEKRVHEGCTHRRGSCITRSHFFYLQNVTCLRVVDTKLDGYLCVVLYEERRPERDVLDVVGSELHINQYTMLHSVLLGFEVVQELAFSMDRYPWDGVESTTFKSDPQNSSSTVGRQRLTRS